MKVVLYDTTLRDGTQAEDIAFSVEDKLRIAEKLDGLGVHYIEGGWPGSNERDTRFFAEARKLRLRTSCIAAFGSTARSGVKPEKDANIRAILNSGVDTAAIVGKSWDLHVHEALRTTLDLNISLIYESIKYLKKRLTRVFFDAEHFFDGWKSNRDYALSVLRAAESGGADCLVLCDTNGGTLPWDLEEAVTAVKKEVGSPLGIHVHNDAGLAVSNTLHAVRLGVTHIQGTINGFGERCGNANLCTLIPSLVLKMGIRCASDAQLRRLREVSRFVYELANLSPFKRQPYVGDSAFAHKGGIHVSAVRRNPRTYEHVQPERVGNVRRVLISDLSGTSSVLAKAGEFNIDLRKKDRVTQAVLTRLKEMEGMGYQYEGAEGSFELLIKKALNEHKKSFRLIGFRVIDEKRKEDEPPYSEATIMVEVGGKVEHTAAVGNGPVNALDNALRKALEKFYPELREVSLKDYKVRVISSGKGTGASVRVLIESGDKKDTWGTVGLSHNIIEASWQALVDSIDYKLLKEEKE